MGPTLPPRRRPGFEPRFTLGMLYLAFFFGLYCLMIVAPPLWELWQTLPPGAEEDEAALRAASELARTTLQPRLLWAFVAAVATTGILGYAGALPGTGRRQR